MNRAGIDVLPPVEAAYEREDFSGSIDSQLDVLTPTTVSEIERIIKACENRSYQLDHLLTQHLKETLAAPSL